MPLPTKISQASQSQVKFRVLSAQFGNGYEQVKPDGINNAYSEWSVVWESVTQTERDTITSTLYAAGASEIIAWTPPGFALPAKFRMTADGFTQTYKAGNVYTISCSLKQVF